MTRYRLVKIPVEHPLAQGLTVQCWEHRLVLWNKIGPGAHPCHWCGRIVEWKYGTGQRGGDQLVADHVNSDRRDNRPENLVPACQGCNAHRTRRIGADELHIVRPDGKRVRAEERVCLTCGTTFLAASSEVRSRPNAGRYCSMPCVYRRANQ